MATSPERYCLGGLIKDIDKEINPLDFDFESKDETAYKTSSEHKLSSDSIYSFASNLSIFSHILNGNKLFSQYKSSEITLKKEDILSAFNNQRNTILLQKCLLEKNHDLLNNIINEMSGTFSEIIKNKNGNYFCSDLFKVCDKNQRIMILKEIYNALSEDCVDEYGTHPIQTLIVLSECEEEYKLILSSFNDYNKILRASLNPNGSYVIQKIIVHIPERYRMEFNLLFLKKPQHITQHPGVKNPFPHFLTLDKSILILVTKS